MRVLPTKLGLASVGPTAAVPAIYSACKSAIALAAPSALTELGPKGWKANQRRQIVAVNGGDKVRLDAVRNRQWQRQRTWTCAGLTVEELELVERTGGQLVPTLVHNIVEDVVLVVEAAAAANGSFSVAPGVPGKTDLRSKVRVGLANAVAQARSPLIQEISGAGYQDRGRAGDGRQVAIGASGVTHVANSVVQGEVGVDLPGITRIGFEAGIKQTPAGIAECGLVRVEALPIAHYPVREWIVADIGVAAAKGHIGVGGEIAGVVRLRLHASRGQQVIVDIRTRNGARPNKEPNVPTAMPLIWGGHIIRFGATVLTQAQLSGSQTRNIRMWS